MLLSTLLSFHELATKLHNSYQPFHSSYRRHVSTRVHIKECVDSGKFTSIYTLKIVTINTIVCNTYVIKYKYSLYI